MRKHRKLIDRQRTLVNRRMAHATRTLRTRRG
jgi:hypothetical protein